MKSSNRSLPALIVHGGAGARAPSLDRMAHRQGILKAARYGVEILQQGGLALDAVTSVVKALEDDPLFNAGYGSVLTAEGTVEMDAALMTFTPAAAAMTAGPRSRNHADESMKSTGAAGTSGPRPALAARAGGAVAAVSRVRNPILLARAVMEMTPHLLMTGAGAERLARRARLRLCRPSDLITERARARWRAALDRRLVQVSYGSEYGTVGAVAVDSQGRIAAATSTGGVTGKMAGRIGDSAIIGAGVFASEAGGSSATGQGEAIIQSALCREAVSRVARSGALAAAQRAVAVLARTTSGEAGVIVLDRRGRFGYAHNAESMQVALYDVSGGLRQLWVEPMRS